MEIWNPPGGGSSGITSGGYINPGFALALYNVGTSGAANFEKLNFDWSSNVARMMTQAGGTGTNRSLQVGSGTGTTFNVSTLYNASGTIVHTAGATSTGHSFTSSPNLSFGTQQIVTVNPVITQSGTAAYTALEISVTESSTGSGTKLLQRWAVGGSEVARMGNTGILQANGGLKAGSSGGNPLSTLESGGSFGVTITSTSTDLTVDATHCTVLVDASGGSRTITLPAAIGCSRRVYNIKKTDNSANTVTVDANAAETIDGALTQVLTVRWQSLTIQSDGTSWYVI